MTSHTCSLNGEEVEDEEQKDALHDGELARGRPHMGSRAS